MDFHKLKRNSTKNRQIPNGQNGKINATQKKTNSNEKNFFGGKRLDARINELSWIDEDKHK